MTNEHEYHANDAGSGERPALRGGDARLQRASLRLYALVLLALDDRFGALLGEVLLVVHQLEQLVELRAHQHSHIAT